MRCFLKITIYTCKSLPGSWKAFPALPLTHAVASLSVLPVTWSQIGKSQEQRPCLPSLCTVPWGGCKAEDKTMFFCQGHNKLNQNYFSLIETTFEALCLFWGSPVGVYLKLGVENWVFLFCWKAHFQSKQIFSCHNIPGNFWCSVAVWHYGFNVVLEEKTSSCQHHNEIKTCNMKQNIKFMTFPIHF